MRRSSSHRQTLLRVPDLSMLPRFFPCYKLECGLPGPQQNLPSLYLFYFPFIHRHDLTLHLPNAWASTLLSSSVESGQSCVMVAGELRESSLSLHPLRPQDHSATSRMSLTIILFLL